MSLDDLAKDIARKYLEGASSLDLKTFCFKEQYDFIMDPARFKVAVCGRRSGKTTACAAHLIHEATSKKNRICLYITLSRLNAKRIIWTELLRINREYFLNGEIKEGELSIRFENGSVIYLSGAMDSGQIELFRGLGVSLCYIDEAQSFRGYIKDLVNDILGPALLDYRGTLAVIGTPGPVPSGFFYEVYHSKEAWSAHHWTMWQNPYIAIKSGQSHQQVLLDELTRRGVKMDDASIQREFFGKWVLDSDSLLLHYNADENHFEDGPKQKLNYIMGIDIGFDDADAIAVLAWGEQSPVTYLVEEFVGAKQTLSELAVKIEELQRKYGVAKMMIDEGGLGKKLAEELRRRFHLPVQPADKARKMENIAFLNDALRTKRFMAKKNSRFAQDSYLVEIDRDQSTPDRIKLKDSYHSDIIDAVLYAFKESPAFTYQEPKPTPKYGSPEWALEQVSEMEEAAEEYFTRLNDSGEGFA